MDIFSKYYHWTLSPLAKWIWKAAGAPPIPPWATAKEGREDDRMRKANYPIANWLVNTAIDKVERWVKSVPAKWEDIHAYIQNRYVSKVHLIDTGLKPGDWYEPNNRLLHGAFAVLVDYVEVALAIEKNVWSDNPTPYRFLKEYRNAEQGIAKLEEQRGYTHDAYEGGPTGLTPSAVDAEEIRTLYAWWTVTRPNRRDPYSKIDPWNGKFSMFDADHSEEEHEAKTRRRKAWKASVATKLEQAHKLEQIYEKEDQDMLIRLIKVRGTMWT